MSAPCTATDFSPADKQQVEMDLTNEAIKDARKHAEAMAAGFGRKLGLVTGVTTGSLKNLTNAMGLYPSDFVNRKIVKMLISGRASACVDNRTGLSIFTHFGGKSHAF